MEEENQNLEAGIPLVAAAAAQHEPMEPLLEQLLDIVRPIYRQIRRRKKGDDDDAANKDNNFSGNFHDDQEGELLIRLGHLLEASSGDIHLAAALFLDDFVASTALNDSNMNNPLPPRDDSYKNADKDEVNRKGSDRKKHSGNDDDVDYDELANEEEGNSWIPRKRTVENSTNHTRRLFKPHGLERLKSPEIEFHGHDKPKLCTLCGRSGHFAWVCPELPKVCDRCGRTGHLATTCTELPPPQEDTDDEGEGNEDVQIRLQENQNPIDVRVSISDDEIPFDPHDLASLRRKWLGQTQARSSRSRSLQQENLDHASHSHKRVKQDTSTSASDLNRDEKIQNKSIRRSRGSSSSLDSLDSCDSTKCNHKDEMQKDVDFTDRDDDCTDKAVCRNSRNDSKTASPWNDLDTYGNLFKYEDMFERNHDSEPSLLLWGPPAQCKDPEIDPSGVDDTQAQGRQQQGQRIGELAMDNFVGANVNPVENESAYNPNIASDPEEKKMATIPWTWFGCGFQLSFCGTGLILPQPDVDTLQKIKKVHATHRRLASSLIPGKVPPAPLAYCGGVTALVSLVTALLYSGASIVGHEVNCNKDRTQFAELSVEERKLEFPRRLSDALAVILFIAAKESHEKRKLAITLLESELNKEHCNKRSKGLNTSSDVDLEDLVDPSRDDCESMIKQDLHRQCRLVPVCRWEVEESEVKKPYRLSISMCNIEDLRFYVHSNISQFMKPGGIALLLESLVHMYGRGRLAKTLRKQRRKSGKKTCIRSLVSCNCVEGRFNDWQQQELIKNDKSIIAMSSDTAKTIQPHGHKCLSIELLSLILTGQVSIDVSSWLTKYGVGLLSADTVEGVALSRNMKYPSNLIWLVRGISSYSVLWHKEPTTKENTELLQPFSLIHWSTWYTGPNKTTLKVIPCYCNKVVDFLATVDNDFNSNVDYVVTSHPEDKILHPVKYERWRFYIKPVLEESLDNVIKPEEDAGALWIPYYRLNRIQKRIVDKKMSPQITQAIWSRWDEARIDAICNDE